MNYSVIDFFPSKLHAPEVWLLHGGTLYIALIGDVFVYIGRLMNVELECMWMIVVTVSVRDFL
jgi:hypothetical protein